MGEFNSNKYKNDFAKEKYDRIALNVPKGTKPKIEIHRIKKGYKSLNDYINDLIRKDMNEAPASKNINVQNVLQNGDNNSINIG